MKHTTNFFKGFLTVAIIMMASLFTASCSKRDRLPERKITKLVSTELDNRNVTVGYADVTTGYYELNDEGARYRLRKLEAAGLITYKAECVIEKKQDRALTGYRYGYWWEDPTPVYSYRTVEYRHYFVNVQLTEAAKQYLVDTIIPNKREPDFLFLTVLDGDYPEDAVSWEEGDVPVINPEKKESPKSQNQDTESHDTVASDDYEPETDTAVKDEPEKVKEKEVTSAPKESVYEQTLKKCHSKVVHVRLYHLKVNKVANIRVNGIAGTAECQCQILLNEVTPFGRILGGYKEKQCFYASPSFVFYQDKGWFIGEFAIDKDLEDYNIEIPEEDEEVEEVDV